MHDEHAERAVAVGGGMVGPGDAFHVAIPSAPGCGLSGPAHPLGWDTGRVVQAWTRTSPAAGAGSGRVSDLPHVQLPVAVTRGTRWPCRG